MHAMPKIEIGETRRITDREVLGLSEITDVQVLFEDFITDVVADRSTFTVDSFPFLYSAIGLSYRLRIMTDFVLDVGEGLALRGQRSEGPTDLIKLSILFHDRVHMSVPMSTPQMVLLVSRLISDLVRSIAAGGIDPYAAFEKFPPPTV